MFKKFSTQFIKFCVTGLICTIVSYATFYISLEFFAIHYLIASAIGFISGIFVGYPVNRAWTFDAKHHNHQKILPYFMVYIFSIILSLIFLRIVVGYFGVDAKIAYILSIAITTCTNFIGTRFFVFKSL
ncbi:MAG TPA: GtrA family protein [Rickettsiales bacterium]|nr:GtrA family protein [Rickettsiales bacterium]